MVITKRWDGLTDRGISSSSSFPLTKGDGGYVLLEGTQRLGLRQGGIESMTLHLLQEEGELKITACSFMTVFPSFQFSF